MIRRSGPASPLRPDLLNAVKRATDAEVAGRAGGADDGDGRDGWQDLRVAGIPTYGIQGFFFVAMTSGFMAAMSGWACAFYEGQTFLYELVKMLAGGSGELRRGVFVPTKKP